MNDHYKYNAAGCKPIKQSKLSPGYWWAKPKKVGKSNSYVRVVEVYEVEIDCGKEMRTDFVVFEFASPGAPPHHEIGEYDFFEKVVWKIPATSKGEYHAYSN